MYSRAKIRLPLFAFDASILHFLEVLLYVLSVSLSLHMSCLCWLCAPESASCSNIRSPANWLKKWLKICQRTKQQGLRESAPRCCSCSCWNSPLHGARCYSLHGLLFPRLSTTPPIIALPRPPHGQAKKKCTSFCISDSHVLVLYGHLFTCLYTHMECSPPPRPRPFPTVPFGETKCRKSSAHQSRQRR